MYKCMHLYYQSLSLCQYGHRRMYIRVGAHIFPAVFEPRGNQEESHLIGFPDNMCLLPSFHPCHFLKLVVLDHSSYPLFLLPFCSLHLSPNSSLYFRCIQVGKLIKRAAPSELYFITLLAY